MCYFNCFSICMLVKKAFKCQICFKSIWIENMTDSTNMCDLNKGLNYNPGGWSNLIFWGKSSQHCAFICEKKRLNWTILFFGLGRVKHQKALKWRGLGGNNGTASPFAFARISIRLCVAEQRNEIRFRKSADVSLERNCHHTSYGGWEGYKK